MAVTSQGTCTVCNRVFAKTQITRHLVQCARTSSEGNPWFHLLVEGRYQTGYWLHLQASPDATLADLDGFLRDIWLECCGHLSEFRIGERSFVSQQSDDLEAKSMGVALRRVLRPESRFIYTYDFGSSTELKLRVLAERHGPTPSKKIVLLARNLPPDIACDACGAEARQICSQCSWSGPGWLCDECAEEHGCGEEMILPVVNSPRTGVCGYTG